MVAMPMKTVNSIWKGLVLFVFATTTVLGSGGVSATPHLKRPRWLDEDGLVIAGSWESAAYRQRANGQVSQLVEKLRREQSLDTALEIKRLGYNVAIIPLYKGWGFNFERDGMEATKRFSEVCHKVGLKVGVYVFSGTVNYETILQEIPSARDWFVLRPDKTRVFYSNKYYRQWVNRSHPGVREHVRELVRFAIQEAHVDLLHFDNYFVGPGYEPSTLPQFKEYLKRRYTAEDRKQRFGFESGDFIELPPPLTSGRDYRTDPLFRDFVDFRCQTLAGTFAELSRYARELNPEIALCINLHPYRGNVWVDPVGLPSVDHTLFLGNTHMFWAEGYPSKLDGEKLDTRFLSHKLGRQFGASVLQYTNEPVAMAESLALGLNTLGCSAWFENGDFRQAPFSEEGTPLDKDVLDLIRFYRANAPLYREAQEIADVAVIHTYENDAFASSESRAQTRAFEQLLYQSRVPFAIVPGRFPGELSRYRVVALAGVDLVPDTLVARLREYVAGGGRVLIAGDAGDLDGEYHSRNTKLAAQLGATAAPEPQLSEEASLPLNRADLLGALKRAMGRPYQVEVTGPDTLAMAAYQLKDGRRTVHLVNYDSMRAARNVVVRVEGGNVRKVTLLAPGKNTNLRIHKTGTRAEMRAGDITRYAVLIIE